MDDSKYSGAFPMDIGGPVRPLVLDDARHQTKTPAQRRQLIALVLLVILVIALVITLIVLVMRYEYNEANEVVERICETEECIRSADNLIQSMDPAVPPCQDFYRFACGRWSEDHPLPDASYSNDWFSETSTLINQQIQDYLETNDSDTDPLPVNQARQLYRSCMDTERLDDMSLEPMMKIMKQLEIPLPLPSAKEQWANFSLMWVLARIQRTMGLDVLIGFSVAPQPTNRTINRLSVSSPSKEPIFPGYPEVLLHNNLAPRRRRRSLGASNRAEMAEAQYIAHVMELSYRFNRSEDSSIVGKDPRYFDAAERVDKFEDSLDKIQNKSSSLRPGVEPEHMTVNELQSMMDMAANGTSRINWKQYLEVLFEGVENTTLDLDNSDTILVYDIEYLRALSAILAKVDNNTLQNYIWWKVAATLAPYTDSELRLLKERYLEDATEGFSPQSRPHFCAQAVNELMGMAVATFFLDTNTLNSTRHKVLEMLQDIRSAFYTLVDKLDWMDEDTKQETREKAEAMDFLVGFPDWISDKESLEGYYSGVVIDENNFLENLVNIAGVSMNGTLSSLRESNDRDGWEAEMPMEPNAGHLPHQNIVVVQAGILQFPFYRLGLEALNYGAIGSILGHELTHGFDDQGRKYDKDGNLRQWWSNKTIAEYVNRTDCFIKQYSSYKLPEVNLTVDGEQTLGENIADNGGLREALRAYWKFRERHGQEEKLPGLEKYTDEQLFFLSFANVWCEKWTKQSMRNSYLDEHSPNPLRVSGVLVNSPEFSRVWNCPKGSHMNPHKEQCVVW
ncbi:neprilysin-11 [Anabrus simplex]|uniref:neprilysin-11 n=1 Tax=Anabrus simplex TaxID=316456 RepID=UPI0035A29435